MKSPIREIVQEAGEAFKALGTPFALKLAQGTNILPGRWPSFRIISSFLVDWKFRYTFPIEINAFV